jgi:pyruvate dehydrogenase E2 component (dihydrolipoamide acetyltransferase)
MSLEFKLPDLGEGIHEAEILAVKVTPGQMIAEDDPIFEVETDKAVVEIPSPFAGVVDKVNVSVGQTIKVGTVMVTLKGEDSSKPEEQPAQSRQSDKASAPKGASASTAAASPQEIALAGGRQGQLEARTAVNEVVPAAPSTRRLARELGINLQLVDGTGSGGRVLSEDVRSFAAKSLEPMIAGSQAVNGAGQAPVAATFVPTLPDFSKHGPIERVPLRSVRRKTAEIMTFSARHIPQATQFDEAVLTALDVYRKQYQGKVESKGAKLSFLSFVLKTAADALAKYPQFNASFDEQKQEIILKRYFNVGVAVATERGLIVPVIKDVDQKSVIELTVELSDIITKTKSGKIDLDRLQGGTFTLTNIGAIGGTSMLPLVNFPESAILAMAKATQRPIVRDGKLAIGLIMPLALSFDHRLADGAEAANLMRDIVKRLQEPQSFSMEA